MDTGNLLSGILGALLGAAAALWGQRIERRHRARMAGRAVGIELMSNSTWMMALKDQGLTAHAFQTEMFYRFLPEIADLVNYLELHYIALAYWNVMLVEQRRQGILRGIPLTPRETDHLDSTVEDLSTAQRVLAPYLDYHGVPRYEWQRRLSELLAKFHQM